MDDLLSIGEVARASGLSVSALRFYDRSAVLVPAEVAPSTGYRWYTHSQVATARLLARLRQVGLPLAEISIVLAHEDPQVTDRILAQHVRRLEDGLEAARAEIERIRHRWIGGEDGEAVLGVAGGDLVEALRAVRYAVGSDPQWPALNGVLLETAGEGARFVATDRYRAAFHEVPASDLSGTVRDVVPAAFVDRLIDLVGSDDRVELVLGGGRVRAIFAGDVHEAHLLDADFPDLTRALPSATASVVVEGAQLLADLDATPQAQTWHVGMGADGAAILSDEDLRAGEDGVMLDGKFFTQAVRAAGPGQLQLDLAGSIAPLAIRRAEEPGSFSIIMPIRPEEGF